MTVKVYQGKKFLEGVQIARKNRLYVPSSNFVMFKLYKGIEQFSYETRGCKIAIKTVNDKPVACVLYTSNHFENESWIDSYNAFCKKSERKKGYARECYLALKAIPSSAYTSTRSGKVAGFWQKCRQAASDIKRTKNV